MNIRHHLSHVLAAWLPAGPAMQDAAVRGSLAAVLLMLLSAGATADDITWINPTSGDWADGTNWDSGNPPGPVDQAIIGNGGTVQVLALDAQADVVIARSGGLEFAPGGSLDSGNALVGIGPDANAHLTMNGGIWTLKRLTAAACGGGQAIINLSGGAHLLADDLGGFHQIGYPAPWGGCLVQEHGSGMIHVSGPGTRFDTIGLLNLGGPMHVTDGAVFQAFGGNIFTSSDLIIDGPGSSVTSTIDVDLPPGLSLGGILFLDQIVPGVAPTVTVANGATLRLKSDIVARGAILTKYSTGNAFPTIRIGDGGAPGTLDIRWIMPMSNGTFARIIFNHNAPDYHFSHDSTATGDPIATAFDEGTYVMEHIGTGTTTIAGHLLGNGATYRVRDGRMVFDSALLDGAAMLIGTFPTEQGTVEFINGAVTQDFSFLSVGSPLETAGDSLVRIDGPGTSVVVQGRVLVYGTGSLQLSNGALLNISSETLRTVLMGGSRLAIGAFPGEPPVAPGRLRVKLAASTSSGQVADGLIVFNHNESGYVFSDAANPVEINGNYAVLHENGHTRFALEQTSTGGTLVTGGTLRISPTPSGSPLGTGAVTITGTGTLSGSGNVPLTVVEAGGRLDPDRQLTFTENLSLEPGASMALDLTSPGQLPGSGSSHDYIHVEGDLVLDGTIDVQAGPHFTTGSYPIIEVAGTVTDNGLQVNNLPTGYTATVNTSSPPWIELDVARLPGFYSVGGQLSGNVDFIGPTLRNNGGGDLQMFLNWGFTFSELVADGGSYNVTVAQHPSNSICEVFNGSGVISGADVTSVEVQCTVPQATLAPETLVFSLFAAGDPPTSRIVVFENTGPIGIPVYGASILGTHAGDFAVGIDECAGQVLAPGASCGIEVLFDAANTAGNDPRVAVLRISAAGFPIIPNPLNVNLQGFIDGLMRDGFESTP